LCLPWQSSFSSCDWNLDLYHLPWISTSLKWKSSSWLKKLHKATKTM
jgi:hypothetical protein